MKNLTIVGQGFVPAPPRACSTCVYHILDHWLRVRCGARGFADVMLERLNRECDCKFWTPRREPDPVPREPQKREAPAQQSRMITSILIAVVVAAIVLALASCSETTEESHEPSCIDYATRMVLACESIGTAKYGGKDHACVALYEQAYNACNVALESGTTVCIPTMDGKWCRGHVKPPAPKLWKGAKAEPPPPPVATRQPAMDPCTLGCAEMCSEPADRPGGQQELEADAACLTGCLIARKCGSQSTPMPSAHCVRECTNKCVAKYPGIDGVDDCLYDCLDTACKD